MLRRRVTTNASVICVVVTPDDPAFCYRLRERWLEPTPPRPAHPDTQERPCLPLDALDTLSQRLLGLQRAECAYVPTDPRAPEIVDPAADLDPPATPGSAAPDRTAGLPAPPGQAGRP